MKWLTVDAYPLASQRINRLMSDLVGLFAKLGGPWDVFHVFPFSLGFRGLHLGVVSVFGFKRITLRNRF